MEDTFTIPVIYFGKELNFNSQLVILGFTYKIKVDINGLIVWFEPDEERNYRAVIDPLIQGSEKINKNLLKAIAETIEATFK